MLSSIPECFEAAADQYPAAVAVQAAASRITYAELDRFANRIANVLIEESAGEHVGVLLDHDVPVIAAILGVLKAGQTCVPVAGFDPDERLAVTLDDADVRTIVTNAAGQARLRAMGYGGRLVDVDALGDAPDGRPGIAIGPDAIAFILYTSGSTGKPKGVLRTHASPIYCHSFDDYGVTAGDRCTLLPYCHTGTAVTSLLSCLFAGASIHMWDVRARGAALAAWLRDERITVYRSSASVFRAFAATLDGTETFPDLRLVRLSNERVLVKDFETFQRVFGPDCVFLHAVGGSEYGGTGTLGQFALRAGDRVAGDALPVGYAMEGTEVMLVDDERREVAPGSVGEIAVRSRWVAPGYWRRPEETAARFQDMGDGTRTYFSGDLGMRDGEGRLVHLGRKDSVVKLRGHRVDLGEVEAILARHPRLQAAAVAVRDDNGSDARLVAYVVGALQVDELRTYLRAHLPEYMVPSAFVAMDALPLAASGKVDRRALPSVAAGFSRAGRGPAEAGPYTETLREIWCEVLRIDRIGVDTNFYDAGGHSLLTTALAQRIEARLGRAVSVVELFRYPTIRTFAAHLTGSTAAPVRVTEKIDTPTAIAIVGFAGRFAGCADAGEFWELLKDGRDAGREFSEAELLELGLSPALAGNPDYVRRGALLPSFDRFDAPFFGFTPRQAATTDPQLRVFLEIVHQALESAGIPPFGHDGRIALVAGSGDPFYLIHHVLPDFDGIAMDPVEINAAAGFGQLATRTAYLLNFQGPALSVHTACSTSLVSLYVARRELVDRTCDVAIAGGVTVRPHVGHLYFDGGYRSRDGRCRAFDADCDGAWFSSGAGAVVLMRLDDALRRGHTIHGVVCGVAVGNDGRQKAGFAAPSVTGQARVIADCLANAGLEPGDIDYVETHGTGTRVGDPIEVQALSEVFRGVAKDSISIGSVKTNVGHAGTAAGMAGLLKVLLALKNEVIPASLHFQRPNPLIDFASAPFYVNAAPRPWRRGERPRRGAVTALGIGGTNAHAIIEEPPLTHESPSARRSQLLPLSARTSAALSALARQLADGVTAPGAASLADVAYTLQVGRDRHPFRAAVAAATPADAAARLCELASVAAVEPRGRLAFLFPGHGSQYLRFGHDLYAAEPHFRARIDALLGSAGLPEGEAVLDDVAIGMPLLFAVELALAQTLIDWGLRPDAMLGHSLGEYTAACIAGVFSPEDALRIVVYRARIMGEQAPGAMLSVSSSAEGVRELLGPRLEIAAINTPERCTVTGPVEEIDGLERALTDRGIEVRRLRVSHAYHSAMMEPALPAFRAFLAGIPAHPPAIPYLSNLTGTWATAADATSPDYWCAHLRHTVRFAGGVAALLESGVTDFVEVGPGDSLSRCVVAQTTGRPPLAVSCFGRTRDASAEQQSLIEALALLWKSGRELDWPSYWSGESRRRVPLPTYPFERKRHWLDRRVVAVQPEPEDEVVQRQEEAPTGLAEAIVAVWRRVLGRETISLSDNLFELGGDSLTALRIAAELRKTLGTNVSASAVLDAPTVKSLAASIEGSGNGSATRSASNRDAWLPFLRPAASARLTLYCFSYAGAGASIFLNWPAPSGIDLAAVQLPGREGRSREQPFQSLAAAIDALIRDLDLGRGGLPMAFFGHSLGGRFAFELARELRRRGLRCPTHLVLSGCRAAHLPGRRQVSALPDSALVDELRRNGAPPSVLEDRELMAFLLPAVRADYTMSETAVFTAEEPLEVPITAFGGEEDEQVSRDELEAWSAHTTGPFSSRIFPGGHMFINTARDVVARCVFDCVTG